MSGEFESSELSRDRGELAGRANLSLRGADDEEDFDEGVEDEVDDLEGGNLGSAFDDPEALDLDDEDLDDELDEEEEDDVVEDDEDDAEEVEELDEDLIDLDDEYDDFDEEGRHKPGHPKYEE